MRTKAGWIAIAASIATTTLLIYGAGPIISHFEPIGMSIQGVGLIEVPHSRSELSLAIRASIVISDNCTRETFFTLFRMDTDPPSVYPLGQTIAGNGYVSPWRDAYDIRLSVPSGVPAGPYTLAVRAVYDCRWLGGLLSSRMTDQAPYWRVTLP